MKTLPIGLDAASRTSPDPLFEYDVDVAPREASFEGPAIGDGVDVVSPPAVFDFGLSNQLRGEPFGPIEEPSHHEQERVIAAAVGERAYPRPSRRAVTTEDPGVGRRLRERGFTER